MEFPEARIYEEALNILLYENRDSRPDQELLQATKSHPRIMVGVGGFWGFIGGLLGVYWVVVGVLMVVFGGFGWFFEIYGWFWGLLGF